MTWYNAFTDIAYMDFNVMVMDYANYHEHLNSMDSRLTSLHWKSVHQIMLLRNMDPVR